MTENFPFKKIAFEAKGKKEGKSFALDGTKINFRCLKSKAN